MRNHSLAMQAVLAGAAFAAPASGQGGIPPQPILSISAEAYSMDSIADLNGDGFRDLVLGLPHASQFPRVQLHSGRNGALLASFTGPAGSELGAIVRSTDDVNGDGREEILAGAPMTGRCYLLSCPASGVIISLQSWLRRTPGTGEGYSTSLTRLADLDGDGVEEIAVGDPGFDVLTVGAEGMVEVLDVTTVPPTVFNVLVGPANYDNFGTSLCAIEDVDGDGASELAIGAWQFFGPNGTYPGTAPGFVDVYSGGSLGVAGTPIRFSHNEGFGPFSLFGMAVASVGDVIMGGLIIGMPDPLNQSLARAPTISGPSIFGAGGGSAEIAHENPNPQLGCRDYGQSVSGLFVPAGDGDVDGDGWADVLVGAPENHTFCGNPGKAYLRSGRTGAVLQTLAGPGMNITFGWDVTELDSFNGKESFAVADPAAGKVFVYVL
ncbi:MAG: VCBS repeat-containing protein [Actinobacteria bacterium]|nr:VCBS repeat-containing protein [Actinomycetota bacterium]